jgi:tripartite-type tricarboxylate transporter receptor subunit TctC
VITRRRFALKLSAGSAALLGLPEVRSAEPWPTRPVTIVVPYAPGGNTDLLARALAQGLGQRWKQTVNVENKPGAGTNIGAAAVARAAPDGCTLFIAQSASHGINPTLYRHLPYDALRDFAFVALLAESTLFLVTGAGSPWRGVADISAASRAGTKLAYGSVGIGSPHHLAGQLLTTRLQLDAQHVPYRGSAAVLQALAAGEVQFAFDATALAWVKDGRLRALAVARPQRWPLAPDIPSMAEQGVADFEVGGWFGLAAPAATPRELLARIAGDVVALQAGPDWAPKLADLGLAPLSGGPEAMRDRAEKDIAKYAALVRAAGATAD